MGKGSVVRRGGRESQNVGGLRGGRGAEITSERSEAERRTWKVGVIRMLRGDVKGGRKVEKWG